MRQLVILRPEPGASASAVRARALGLEVAVVPLFVVRPVKWNVVPDDFDAIVATSANAFRHGGPGLAALRQLPVHAVGEATADAARAAGFTVAAIGSGGADQLALPAGRALHLTGRDHVAMPGAQAVVVYEAVAASPIALDVAGSVVAVHSARAGRRLGELVAERSRTAIAAISAVAAQACDAGWETVAVASAPRETELLALASELCQNPVR